MHIRFNITHLGSLNKRYIITKRIKMRHPAINLSLLCRTQCIAEE